MLFSSSAEVAPLFSSLWTYSFQDFVAQQTSAHSFILQHLQAEFINIYDYTRNWFQIEQIFPNKDT